MKKFVHLFLCLLLVVALFCVFSVTSMALTDKQVSDYKIGSAKVGNLTYDYSFTTTASNTFASAGVGCSRNIRVSAKIEIELTAAGVPRSRTATDIVTGTSAYASLTNIWYDEDTGEPYPGIITKATGIYTVGTLDSYTYTLK